MILAVVAGCSSLRKGKTNVPHTEPAPADYSALIGSVIDNNITEVGFEIRKGSIELEGTEIEGRFGLHARLNSRGDFYCSVRGPLGIELVRLLMVGNDIAAIDRINKTVYVGKKDAVLRRNGMPSDFMKIIFGDMPSENEGNFRSGSGGTIALTAGDEDFARSINVCPDEMKVCSETIDAKATEHQIYLTFSNFVTSGERRHASLITMEEKKRMFHVKLNIDDLILGYNSDIEFNLPSYRRESL